LSASGRPGGDVGDQTISIGGDRIVDRQLAAERGAAGVQAPARIMRE
jgi:hypothetical protein